VAGQAVGSFRKTRSYDFRKKFDSGSCYLTAKYAIGLQRAPRNSFANLIKTTVLDSFKGSRTNLGEEMSK
jgi:hypothetical protein